MKKERITRKRVEEMLDQNIRAINRGASLRDSWLCADPLFRFVMPFDIPVIKRDVRVCGCLTQIRTDSDVAAHQAPDLTQAIREDARIPSHWSMVRREHLQLFKEWQLAIYDYYHSKSKKPWRAPCPQK